MDRIRDDDDSGSFGMGSLAGRGLSRFLTNQDPDSIKFEKFKNGYRITVVTDEENAQNAKEFWENNVVPQI